MRTADYAVDLVLSVFLIVGVYQFYFWCQRHPLVPDVPTFEESGFKGYDGVQWYGIVGPAKLPAEITARLNAEINKALATPALKERLSAEALEPMPMTPEQFGRFIQADIARWSKLARERKISLDD